jgi:hypothetical protein
MSIKEFWRLYLSEQVDYTTFWRRAIKEQRYEMHWFYRNSENGTWRIETKRAGRLLRHIAKTDEYRKATKQREADLAALARR